MPQKDDQITTQKPLLRGRFGQAISRIRIGPRYILTAQVKRVKWSNLKPWYFFCSSNVISKMQSSIQVS